MLLNSHTHELTEIKLNQLVSRLNKHSNDFMWNKAILPAETSRCIAILHSACKQFPYSFYNFSCKFCINRYLTLIPEGFSIDLRVSNVKIIRVTSSRSENFMMFESTFMILKIICRIDLIKRGSKNIINPNINFEVEILKCATHYFFTLKLIFNFAFSKSISKRISKDDFGFDVRIFKKK